MPIIRIFALLAALIVPAGAQPSPDKPQAPTEKQCIFLGAERLLPKIPGLTITGSRVVLDERESDQRVSTYRVEIDINAAAQDATYSFGCWLGKYPGTPPIEISRNIRFVR